MATYSSNLNLKKPGYSDPADIADINNNMDIIDTAVDNNSGSMADKYDKTSTYDAGERCVHDNKLYKAKIDISTPETWNAAHWDEVKISDEIDDTNQAVAKLSEGMTYVVNGNKSIESATIPVGSYVRLVNSSITGRSDGIYTVATAIPVDTVIDGTYFNENAPIAGGVANALNAEIESISVGDITATCTINNNVIETLKVLQYGKIVIVTGQTKKNIDGTSILLVTLPGAYYASYGYIGSYGGTFVGEWSIYNGSSNIYANISSSSNNGSICAVLFQG